MKMRFASYVSMKVSIVLYVISIKSSFISKINAIRTVLMTLHWFRIQIGHVNFVLITVFLAIITFITAQNAELIQNSTH
jgi:hypothetical protein